MNVDDVIRQCEAQPVTAERKMILALAREVKRLQGTKGKAKQSQSDGSEA